MTKLNCLSCGHGVSLSDAYDDYDGDVKCLVCGATLAVKLDGGKVRSARCVSTRRAGASERLASAR